MSTTIYEMSDGVATVTLNRPERLNALTVPMMRELMDVLEAADRDPSVRVIIVTGAGRAFCAGGDADMLRDFGARTTPREDELRVLRNGQIAELLRASSAVTIAAVNGPCIGGGLAIACAADLRYCGASATFSAGYLPAGRSGDLGVSWTLPRIVGPAIAREMFLTPVRVTAERAEQIGLVTAAVADDDLLRHARSAAAWIAGTPPLSAAAVKANLNDADTASFRDHLVREAKRLAQVSRTQDAAEAVRSLREKTPPHYFGR